ncbi:stage II sporulation protein M [Candidatus Woesearchaeota archaeon]|nr:stage II sporulation protein M [Candidatus Woesearchaeota archaeon]
MVFESIVNPEKAESHPLRMFLLGMFYSTIGVLLSLWIFYQWSSLVMVFLTVLASVPLVYNTLRFEEEKDKEIYDEKLLLKQHGRALFFLLMLFIGFVIGFSLWYLVLPESTVKHAFNAQITTIEAINSPVGRVISLSTFMKIFSNNMRVLFFCVFFAFFYGAGAIFILAWNASIIGTALGNFIRQKLAELASNLGFVSAGAYLHVFSLGLLRYMTHGIFEILGYFIGGLAGGIISVAVIRHDFGTKEFNHIIADSLDLVILAILILFIAALIEVYITPLIV